MVRKSMNQEKIDELYLRKFLHLRLFLQPINNKIFKKIYES
jgi:hypothetical protein